MPVDGRWDLTRRLNGYRHSDFLDRCSKNTQDIKFHEVPSSGIRVVLCGRTDGLTGRHDDANSRFSQILQKNLKHLRCVANSDTAAQLSDYVSVARKLKLPPKCMMYTPDKYHRRQFGTFQDEAPDRASSASKLWMNFTALLTRSTWISYTLCSRVN